MYAYTTNSHPPQDIDIRDIDRQFETDVPRIAFFVDDISLDSTRTKTLATYLSKWSKIHSFEVKVIQYWCTQIALAPIYVRMVNRLTAAGTRSVCKMHLIDGGYQHIVLRSSGSLYIQKPFKLLLEDQHTMHTVGTMTLYIDVTPEQANVRWVHSLSAPGYSWQDPTVVYTTLALFATWGALQWIS